MHVADTAKTSVIAIAFLDGFIMPPSYNNSDLVVVSQTSYSYMSKVK